MAYSNSPLVKCTILSPNCNSPRNHAIDTITIHEVWGQMSAEALGQLFVLTSRQASSNYGIGSDGRVGLYVNESDRAWTSGSWENDHRAVTIECSNDRTYPYAVNAAAYESLIKLCADICKRNGKNKMIWCGSLSATNARSFKSTEMRMTLHKWFQATDCPGYWLETHMGEIADRVNSILSGKEKVTDGWEHDGEVWRYWKNGKMVTGWQKIAGDWYFFTADGVMLTGWLSYKDKWYYLKPAHGEMVTGWYKVKGKWYWFKDSGAMVSEKWKKWNGKWYYLSGSGAMIAGKTVEIKGKKYTFDEKGALID